MTIRAIALEDYLLDTRGSHARTYVPIAADGVQLHIGALANHSSSSAANVRWHFISGAAEQGVVTAVLLTKKALSSGSEIRCVPLHVLLCCAVPYPSLLLMLHAYRCSRGSSSSSLSLHSPFRVDYGVNYFKARCKKGTAAATESLTPHAGCEWITRGIAVAVRSAPPPAPTCDAIIDVVDAERVRLRFSNGWCEELDWRAAERCLAPRPIALRARIAGCEALIAMRPNAHAPVASALHATAIAAAASSHDAHSMRKLAPPPPKRLRACPRGEECSPPFMCGVANCLYCSLKPPLHFPGTQAALAELIRRDAPIPLVCAPCVQQLCGTQARTVRISLMQWLGTLCTMGSGVAVDKRARGLRDALRDAASPSKQRAVWSDDNDDDEDDDNEEEAVVVEKNCGRCRRGRGVCLRRGDAGHLEPQGPQASSKRDSPTIQSSTGVTFNVALYRNEGELDVFDADASPMKSRKLRAVQWQRAVLFRHRGDSRSIVLWYPGTDELDPDGGEAEGVGANYTFEIEYGRSSTTKRMVLRDGAGEEIAWRNFVVRAVPAAVASPPHAIARSPDSALASAAARALATLSAASIVAKTSPSTSRWGTANVPVFSVPSSSSLLGTLATLGEAIIESKASPSASAPPRRTRWGWVDRAETATPPPSESTSSSATKMTFDPALD